jgi:hypothetical protein
MSLSIMFPVLDAPGLSQRGSGEGAGAYLAQTLDASGQGH